jgi:hypothetical protein
MQFFCLQFGKTPRRKRAQTGANKPRKKAKNSLEEVIKVVRLLASGFWLLASGFWPKLYRTIPKFARAKSTKT